MHECKSVGAFLGKDTTLTVVEVCYGLGCFNHNRVSTSDKRFGIRDVEHCDDERYYEKDHRLEADCNGFLCSPRNLCEDSTRTMNV
jgi:hypothetical protein